MSFKYILTIIIVSTFISGSLFGYRLFWQAPAAPALTTGGAGVIAQGPLAAATPEERERVEYSRRLQNLENLSLDDKVLRGPSLRALDRFNQFVAPAIAPYRANPFVAAGF